MYTCTICKEDKRKSELNRISSQNKKTGQCKVCRNAKTKAWRADNPDKVVKLNKAYRKVNRQKLVKYNREYYQDHKDKWIEDYLPKYINKVGQSTIRQNVREYHHKRYAGYGAWLNEVKSVPCADCMKEFPPVCMQFDHIPERGEKKFNLASGYGKKDLEINEELAKCDIVCANCHMIRTHILRK